MFTTTQFALVNVFNMAARRVFVQRSAIWFWFRAIVGKRAQFHVPVYAMMALSDHILVVRLLEWARAQLNRQWSLWIAYYLDSVEGLAQMLISPHQFARHLNRRNRVSIAHRSMCSFSQRYCAPMMEDSMMMAATMLAIVGSYSCDRYASVASFARSPIVECDEWFGHWQRHVNSPGHTVGMDFLPEIRDARNGMVANRRQQQRLIVVQLNPVRVGWCLHAVVRWLSAELVRPFAWD